MLLRLSYGVDLVLLDETAQTSQQLPDAFSTAESFERIHCTALLKRARYAG